MKYFLVRVVIYECKMFIRLATDIQHLKLINFFLIGLCRLLSGQFGCSSPYDLVFERLSNIWGLFSTSLRPFLVFFDIYPTFSLFFDLFQFCSMF